MSTRANVWFYITMAVQAVHVILGFVLVGTLVPAQDEATMNLVNAINLAVVGVHCYALAINATESTVKTRWFVVTVTIVLIAFTFSIGIIADTRTGYFVHAEDVTYAIVAALIVLFVFLLLRSKPAVQRTN